MSRPEPTAPSKSAANGHPNRRRFLATSSAIAVAPMFIPARAFGANDRVITGHIGVGGQGRSNLMQFADHAAILCDVDSSHLATATEKLREKTGRAVDGVADFRRILDRKDIDAVVISTPDHWHAIPTIEACRAGKDVYCEKPLSLTIDEGVRMVEAARQHNRIVQTGSQQRSDAKFRLACQLVRSGRIGKLKEVHVGIPESNHPFGKRSPSPIPNRRHRSITTAGSVPRRCVPTTSTESITTSASFGITPVAKSRTSAPTTSTSPIGGWGWMTPAHSASKGKANSTPKVGSMSRPPAA